MPILQDFTLGVNEDGTLSIPMVPATPIGGWTIQYNMMKYFGGVSGIATKYLSSGFNGASGITVTNSGQGIFNVSLFASDTSGLQFGSYAYTITRTDSGSHTNICEGWRLAVP